MAASSDLLPELVTSDEVIDRYCEPCFKDGTVRDAAGYCLSCDEFYCQNCLGTHRRSALTERHRLLLDQEIPLCQYPVCDKHITEWTRSRKNMYCFDHHNMICMECVEIEHLGCRVQDLEDVYKGIDTSEEENNFSQRVSLIFKNVASMKQSLENNAKSLDEQESEILREGIEHRDKIIKQIFQSYQDFAHAVTKEFRKQNATLASTKPKLDKVITDVKAINQSFQRSSKSTYNDQKKFIDALGFTEKLQVCEDKIKQLAPNRIGIKCTFNIQPLIVARSELGEFTVQSLTSPSDWERQSEMPAKLTWSEKIKVKLDSDEQDNLIQGIAISTDGNLLLADAYNLKVKYFSRNGVLLSFLKLPEIPVDVAVINNSKAAVGMINKQIGFISIDDNDELHWRDVIKTKQEIKGLTSNGNDLFITCDKTILKSSSVQQIDMTGKVLWTVSSTGNIKFKSPLFLTTHIGDSVVAVIVTDCMQKTISVLDAHFGDVLKVCHVQDKVPLGVTVDDNGNIFVCFESGEITVLSRDTKEEQCLISGRKSLKCPGAMAYDSQRSELVLTSWDDDTNYSNYIHRLKLSKK